jgi:TFIIF-interacting CTD phosphatase-like protein
MRNFILLFLLISVNDLFAQGVTIHKDPRLDLLISKQVELNKVVYKENNRTGNGFRVLVINTNDRNKAMEVKSRLMSEFPEHKTYLVYQSPYFKIQVGNFRERKEAEALRKKIIQYYPTGVIVVPATVEFKAEKEEGLN